MAEMRYLWSTSISLDGGKLEAFLGDALPKTPLDVAVRETLVGLGCLKALGSQGADRTEYYAGHQDDANRSAA
jgi:hypothetical protein